MSVYISKECNLIYGKELRELLADSDDEYDFEDKLMDFEPSKYRKDIFKNKNDTMYFLYEIEYEINNNIYIQLTTEHLSIDDKDDLKEFALLEE